jgi:hypothetical protein
LPRAVHLPPLVIAALTDIGFGSRTVFGWSKCSRLYEMLDEALGRPGW